LAGPEISPGAKICGVGRAASWVGIAMQVVVVRDAKTTVRIWRRGSDMARLQRRFEFV
jgi:hypothetical protein